MDWFHSLPFKKKLQAGCYTIVLSFSFIMLIILLSAKVKFFTSLIIVAIPIAISYPLINKFEKMLTAPITDISRVALGIAKGNFSLRAEALSDDALGDLGRAFNQMADKLRDILSETSVMTRHVSIASQDMYHKNEHLQAVIAQVNTSAEELAAGAGQISEEVTSATEATKHIENKVHTYAESTRSMSEKSSHMLQVINKGKSAVEMQNIGMKKNVESTKIVSETISRLAEQIAGISKMTRLISEIADQTNLLSLNASIEAARAGEHGRGFAVVALEVRKLAEESTQATKEVFSLVRGIEDGIRRTVASIQSNEEVVNSQTHLIRETEIVFNEIVESVDFITRQIDSFVQESEQMLDSARGISHTMENISAITQQSAAGTQEVSHSMNTQIDGVKAMVGQAEEMLQMVTRLQQSIQVYKV